MSAIQLRIHAVNEPLDKFLLLDLFHLENFRSSIRVDSLTEPWYSCNSVQLEIEDDYFPPILPEETLAEFIAHPKCDGFIVRLDHIINKRSFKKANDWLTNIHDGHIDLIRDMGWDVHLFIGHSDKAWISKKFVAHAKRLQVKLVRRGFKELT